MPPSELLRHGHRYKLPIKYLHNKAYWLATSGGRVPVVAVCVLHTQLRICCAADSAIL